MTEARHTNRIRSFLRGEIIHSNGSSRTECIVRDISDTGARIEAPASVTVPEFFELHIPQRNIQQRVRIVWRHGTELGLTFAGAGAGALAEKPAPRAEESLEIKIRMLELEAETARLRAQLAEMRAALDSVLREKRSA